MTDQGLMIDDGSDEDEDWYEPWKDPDHDREPDEPDWGDDDRYAGSLAVRYRKPVGRERRRIARRLRHDRRERRKVMRHDSDRFWRARNRSAFDDEPPF